MAIDKNRFLRRLSNVTALNNFTHLPPKFEDNVKKISGKNKFLK
jgi:hypothetical protein